MLKKNKQEEVEKIGKLLEEFSVIGILNMHKLPARQLQKIRNSLSEIAIIRMSKKSLTKRGIEKVDKKSLKDLEENISGECALIFSNENPFRLFKILKENRTPAAAKPGDIAPNDITIMKGSTNLPPGPAISTLQKVGLKASVQGGKIAIMADKVAVKYGDKISDDIANVLSLLKMEPMEIGLDLVVAWDDGIIYTKEVLDVDLEQYIKDLQNCVMQAMNLSLNAGYPTKLTIPLMIQKTFAEAKKLCIEAYITEKEFIDDVLAKAIRETEALNNKIGGI